MLALVIRCPRDSGRRNEGVIAAETSGYRNGFDPVPAGGAKKRNRICPQGPAATDALNRHDKSNSLPVPSDHLIASVCLEHRTLRGLISRQSLSCFSPPVKVVAS
jgi:hypothetical protein